LENKIIIRKANMSDLPNIVDIFADAVRVMDENGINQWDEFYPNREDFEKDIAKNQMYLGEIQDKIASAFVLNQDSEAEYCNGKWKYNSGLFMVIHRLCVNPSFQNQGIGTKTLNMIENMLRTDEIKAVRLDAFSLNPYARKMYEKLGYIRVGEVNWRKGLFYLYEKVL